VKAYIAPHLGATERHLPYGITSVIYHLTQVNTPRLTPALQAGTRFTYPGRTEGWVVLVDLIARRMRAELATCITSPTPNHCTTKTATYTGGVVFVGTSAYILDAIML